MSFGLDVLKKAGLAPESIDQIIEKPVKVVDGEASIKRIAHVDFNAWMHAAYVGAVVIVEYTADDGISRDKQRRVLSQALRRRSSFESVIRQRRAGIMIFITGEKTEGVEHDEFRQNTCVSVKTDYEFEQAMMNSFPGDIIKWDWRTKQTPKILRMRTAQRQFAYSKAAKRGVSCLIDFDDTGLTINIKTKKSRGAYAK